MSELTSDEEQFINKCLVDFGKGELKDCEEGCTLLMYLSRKLNCDTSKITDYFARKKARQSKRLSEQNQTKDDTSLNGTSNKRKHSEVVHVSDTSHSSSPNSTSTGSVTTQLGSLNTLKAVGFHASSTTPTATTTSAVTLDYPMYPSSTAVYPIPPQITIPSPITYTTYNGQQMPYLYSSTAMPNMQNYSSSSTTGSQQQLMPIGYGFPQQSQQYIDGSYPNTYTSSQSPRNSSSNSLPMTAPIVTLNSVDLSDSYDKQIPPVSVSASAVANKKYRAGSSSSRSTMSVNSHSSHSTSVSSDPEITFLAVHSQLSTLTTSINTNKCLAFVTTHSALLETHGVDPVCLQKLLEARQCIEKSIATCLRPVVSTNKDQQQLQNKG